MVLLTRRIAERCAPILLMSFLVVSLLIGAPRPHATAQEVSTATIGTFTRPPVPLAQKYVPWASNAGSEERVPTFSLSPKATHIALGVIVGTILLANIRFRPRKPSY